MSQTEFETSRSTIKVSDSIGAVSAMVMKPSHIDGVLVLAHGAGAGMEHPFMTTLAETLAKYHIATVRYNFPFTEKRKGRPDPPVVAEKVVAAVINAAQLMVPGVPLYAGGKSFGGRMTSQLLSRECPPFVRGVVFFGFPLHAPGSPTTARANHLKTVPIPMLFLQGTRDALANIKLMTEVTTGLPKAILKKYEDADHSFKVKRNVIFEDIAVDTVQWFNYVNAAKKI